MLKHLFISSLRSIRRNASSSLINFFGLMFGFVCVQLIGMYLYHELSFDRYHEKAERIYRLTHNEKAGEVPGIRHLATVGPPVAPTLKQEYPQVEQAVRFRNASETIMSVGDNQYYESRVYYIDPSVFSVFSFPLLKGNASTALSLPNNVVITSEMASKYFGDADPIGQTIVMDNSTNLQVTGVLAPLPSNTHLKFDFMIPFEAFKVPFGYPVNLDSWGWISFHTYVLLKPGVEQAEFEESLVKLVRDNWEEERAKRFKIQAQPLTQIYLGDVMHEDIASGNMVYIIVLALAGILILIIAGFNFANLYAVISISRSKEIGMRFIMGAYRSFIHRYLYTEAILFTSLAAVMAGVLLPMMAGAIGFGSILNAEFHTMAIALSVGLAAITGLLAATYPASVLSAGSSSHLVKGKLQSTSGGQQLRRSFVFIQFCITVALISSVLIIQQQMEYIGKKDLGYARDELLLLRLPGENLREKFPALKTRLLQNPDIANVSIGGGRMDGDNGNVPIFVEGNLEEGIPMSIDAATFDFYKTIGVDLIAGREISERQPADTLRGVLLNESAMKVFGWSAEEALGKRIRVGDIVLDGEVIGILPDFNFGPLKSAISPLVVYYPRTRLQDIYVRFQSGADLQALVTSVQSAWQEVAAEFPFDFSFMSEYLGNLYTSEKFFYQLFTLFASAAILISCLGLFAVVSQEVAFRVKEIGIRKTLGATVQSILILVLRPFLLLIGLAGLVAAPLSWWSMKSWLDEFSFHIDIDWTVFVIALLVTIVVAIATISYKVVLAGLANPVKALRSE